MDIRYYLVKNATDTAAKAPYTVRVVPNGVANLNDLVAEILTRISSSEQRVRMALAEAAKVMLKHVLAGETVDFGGIRFKAQIPGSMDYEDSPFEPGVDEVVVCAYADDELRGTFDGIVPAKLSAEEVAASVKVSNVMDVATERFGEIHGTAPFKVLGNGVTLDGEGESAKLLDKKTGEALATAGVTTVSKGQRATCALGPVAGGIARGAYVLEVTTFGLVGETAPRVFRKPVTLAEAVPDVPKPTLTNAHSPGCDPMEVTMHEDVILDGTRLKDFERLVARHEEYAGEIELPTEGVTANDDGTQLSLPGSVWDAITAKVDPSVMPTRPITFEVITGEGSAAISPVVP